MEKLKDLTGWLRVDRGSGFSGFKDVEIFFFEDPELLESELFLK